MHRDGGNSAHEGMPLTLPQCSSVEVGREGVDGGRGGKKGRREGKRVGVITNIGLDGNDAAAAIYRRGSRGRKGCLEHLMAARESALVCALLGEELRCSCGFHFIPLL